MLKQDLVTPCGPTDLELALNRPSEHLWEATSRLCHVSLTQIVVWLPGITTWALQALV